MEGIIAFIIWEIVSLIFVVIGISAWNSEDAVGFFTGQEAPKVNDIKGYNHAVAKLWFVFAGILILLGILLLAGQNSPLIMLSVIGEMFSVIGICVVYMKIEQKYRDKGE